MSRDDSLRVRDQIMKEAVAWFVELNEIPNDQAVREAFDAWLRRSPEHVHAFLRVSIHWEDTDPAARARMESVEELVALARMDSNVVRLGVSDALPLEGGSQGASGSRLRAPIALAASMVVISLLGALLWFELSKNSYSTGIGEQRSLTLADGSRVELNSRSRIRVRYTEHERRVDLLEGEALFHVAHVSQVPFVVRSEDAQVRAVGTQFDIYRKQGDLVVTVVEGKVAVSAAGTGDARTTTDSSGQAEGGDAESPPGRSGGSGQLQSRGHRAAQVFLHAGEQMKLGRGSDGASGPQDLEPAAIEAATAWTQYRLVFKGAPLSEVVREFNRYGVREIVIEDASLAQERISGSFSSSDPSDLFRFLREVGGYQVHETASQIRISRK